MNNATITLSIEIELAWGGDGVESYLSSGRKKEAEYLNKIIKKCEEVGVPITFDIVGALIDPEQREDSCHNLNSSCGNIKDYTPEMIEQLRMSDVNHEFATHTYSHYVFDDQDKFIKEVNKSISVHEEYGLGTPVSFVGPRNKIPPIELLEQVGIDVVRMPISYPQQHNILRFFSLLCRDHPISNIEHSGIVKTYSTWETSLTAPYFLPMGQKPAHFTYKWIPIEFRKRIHQKYLHSALNRAISEESHAHLWTHLYNLSNPIQWELVSRFLEELGRRQQEGEVQIKTMRELR